MRANGTIGSNIATMKRKLSDMGHKWFDDILSKSNTSRNLRTVNAAKPNNIRKKSLPLRSHEYIMIPPVPPKG